MSELRTANRPAAACRDFGIARKAAYPWPARFDAGQPPRRSTDWPTSAGRCRRLAGDRATVPGAIGFHRAVNLET